MVETTPRSEAAEAPPSSRELVSRELAMYRDMVRARLLSDRMFALNRQGRAAFAITGQGHEAAQVGSAYALRAGHDWVLPYYRDIGVMLSLGVTPLEILLGFFAKADDPNSGGRQMPAHWSYPPLRVVTRSSVVGANLPHAAGIAYASKLRGLDEVAIVYFGEGATSEGEFHEALNFAAIHDLPVVFFCENNGYAISEKADKQMPLRRVADRARGYDIHGVSFDGNDLTEVYQTTYWAIEECRRGHGPQLLEAVTYRFGPHTSADDDTRYRPRAEVEEWSRRDPIDRYRQVLTGNGAWSDDREAALREEVRAEIDRAVDEALAAPEPDVAHAMRHVYFEA